MAEIFFDCLNFALESGIKGLDILYHQILNVMCNDAWLKEEGSLRECFLDWLALLSE